MSRFARRALALPVAALLSLVTFPAGAWNAYGVTWPGHVVDYRINPDNLDVSNAAAITAIRFGADAWTDQTKAAFRYNYLGTSTSTSTNNDGLNLVLFRNINPPSPLPSSALGVTYIWSSGSTILDVNIVFFDTKTFITGSTACTGNANYIEQVAIHEFGHALGLDHSAVAGATMYPTTSSCEKDWLTLHADDQLGAETLYPCSASSQCNDTDVCTTDVCQSKKCIRTAVPGCCTATSQCNDSNACTTDACQSNSCTHTAIAGCCTSAAQCNDNKACTTDACQSNSCTHTAIAGCCTSSAQCDDNKACTTDSCQSNSCTHTAIAGCCTSAAQCDDSKPCTTDACQGNSCTHTAIAGCCTSAVQCDDNDACTTDKCQSNACTHTAITGCNPTQEDAGVDGAPADAKGDSTSPGVDASPADAKADAADAPADAKADVGLDTTGDGKPLGDAAKDGPDDAQSVAQSGDSGGCGCAVHPKRTLTGWAAALGALALVLLRSRRREKGALRPTVRRGAAPHSRNAAV